MKALNRLRRLLLRFRYPVTMPEDIAEALGIEISNFLTFEEFVCHLTSPICRPTRIGKQMPRYLAEEAFSSAQRSERFKHNTIYSYYFNEGWLVFVLHFDDQNRLSRLYLQHQRIRSDRGIELHLPKMCIV